MFNFHFNYLFIEENITMKVDIPDFQIEMAIVEVSPVVN